jgi:hypothetical protein
MFTESSPIVYWLFIECSLKFHRVFTERNRAALSGEQGEEGVGVVSS